MVVVAVVGAAVLVGRSAWLEAGLVALSVAAPGVTGGLLMVGVLFSLRSHRSGVDDEGIFLQAMSLELRAGASLRAAIESAAARVPALRLEGIVRQAVVGASIERIAVSLALVLPRHGKMAGAALETAGATGGRVASVFESLSLIAAEDRDLWRERSAATAQARISAWIVGGLPIALLGYGVASGRLRILDSAVDLAIVSVGLLLVGAGVAAVFFMLRRSLR